MASTTNWQTADKAGAKGAANLPETTGGTTANHGDDRILDPATTEGDTHASGNPGANNPGVGNMMSGAAGIKTDTEIARGWDKQGDVGSGVTSAMGAGGIGSTGVIGGPPPQLPDGTGITGPGAAETSGANAAPPPPDGNSGGVPTGNLDSGIGETGGVGATDAGTQGIASTGTNTSASGTG